MPSWPGPEPGRPVALASPGAAGARPCGSAAQRMPRRPAPPARPANGGATSARRVRPDSLRTGSRAGARTSLPPSAIAAAHSIGPRGRASTVAWPAAAASPKPTAAQPPSPLANSTIHGASAPSSTTYSYDPLGRRASRTAAGSTTSFLYDGADVVLDRSSDGSTVDYLNGGGVDDKLRQSSSGSGRDTAAAHAWSNEAPSGR